MMRFIWKGSYRRHGRWRDGIGRCQGGNYELSDTVVQPDESEHYIQPGSLFGNLRPERNRRNCFHGARALVRSADKAGQIHMTVPQPMRGGLRRMAVKRPWQSLVVPEDACCDFSAEKC